MKSIALFLLLLVLLCGCGASPTFETLGDVQHEMPITQQKACVQIPENAEVFAQGETTGWVLERYSVQLQTFEDGDLDEIMQTLCGFPAEELTVMASCTDGVQRYDWVWTAMSEEGETVCRAAILDDGKYRYCLIAEGTAEYAKEFHAQWNAIFSSFSLA